MVLSGWGFPTKHFWQSCRTIGCLRVTYSLGLCASIAEFVAACDLPKARVLWPAADFVTICDPTNALALWPAAVHVISTRVFHQTMLTYILAC